MNARAGDDQRNRTVNAANEVGERQRNNTAAVVVVARMRQFVVAFLLQLLLPLLR